MKRLGPGQTIRITDYSPDPAELLRDLAGEIDRLEVSRQFPVLSLRRGWLHGTHLEITVRGYAGGELDPLLDDFVTMAHHIATGGPRAGLAPPDEADYLTRAEQLARWENREPPFLPVHPQGHVVRAPAQHPPGWPAALVRARDQISARLLPAIRETALRSAAERLPLLVGVMAALARIHPAGIGVGTLPFRSHSEGVASATGSRTDVKSLYAQRFEADAALFTDALTAPLDDPLLRTWTNAWHYGWGVAEALAADGVLDDDHLHEAAGPATRAPMGPLVRSDFFAEMATTRLAVDPPYRHVAYRVVLNTLYSSLSCFGVSPLQRYYFCFGLAEAADRLLGEDANARVRRLAADRIGAPAGA